MSLYILAVAVVLDATALGLAVNPATNRSRWPWPLDAIRQQPFPFLAVFTVFAAVLALAQVFLQQRVAAVAGDPPPPDAPVVPEWVVDREQARLVVAAVLARGRSGRPVGITAGVHGAGGFGKTTVADLVRADRRLRRVFGGRVYEVTIGRDVRGSAAIAAKVAQATKFITGDETAFDDPEMAGAHLGRLLAARPRTLLVLDDVWEAEQLAPFLIGARERCVRLVTTRIPGVLPADAERIEVDRMSPQQARRVLLRDLPTLPAPVVAELLEATGGWALLLRLANQYIAKAIRRGDTPDVAASGLWEALRQAGPAAVDDPALAVDFGARKQRAASVRATIEASVTLLSDPSHDRVRLAELGVFAADEAVPAALVAALWAGTAGLTARHAGDLCLALAELSLIRWDPADGGRLGMHDVIRDYLRAELGAERIQEANAALVDRLAEGLPTAAADPEGSTMPAWWESDEGFVLDHGIEHLLDAGYADQAEMLAADLRWIGARLFQRGPTAAIKDLELIGTSAAAGRARDLMRIAHLLTPTDPAHALTAILHSRLAPLPAWRQQVARLGQAPACLPVLRNLWDPPDLPDPAMRRVLIASRGANSVAISPDGTWLATTGAWDKTVRIWDRAAGTMTAAFEHDDPVRSVAIGPDGTWLATTVDPDDDVGADSSIQIWDVAGGALIATIGHDYSAGSVAIGPDGTWLATTGRSDSDGTVRIWDRAGGTLTTTLHHDDAVRSVAISPDGSRLATTVRGDGTVRIWDPISGTVITNLYHHGTAFSVAISPDGKWVATTTTVSGIYDGTVHIWDVARRVPLSILHCSEPVLSMAISPDGTWLATTGAYRGEMRIWDLTADTAIAATAAHNRSVWSVAIGPDGTWLATTGDGDVGRVRIWDRASGTVTAVLEQVGLMSSVEISPDGTWLATIDDGGGTARIWDLADGTVTASLHHDRRLGSVAISPDGSWLATTDSVERTVRIWAPDSGTVTAALEHPGRVRSAIISPDGARLVTVTAASEFTSISEYVGDTVSIWDLASGTVINTLRHDSPVDSVAISRDGTWLATITPSMSDPMAQIWNVADGTVTATLRHPRAPNSVAISPDGAWLATTEGETVRIWDRVSGLAATMLRTEDELT
ncbi:MAG: hypothetical protein JF587_18420, partial [Catenulisporales bacterium]|nr:hypothetical protein [Catenulisporales bacterium]